MVLTSNLIDGTFPDYARVIPKGNDKLLQIDKSEFEHAVDRVSTVSSERGRAVKLALTGGKVTLSVNNPDSGSATEELEAEYEADPLDIGFNSRYLLDIVSQIEGETAVLRLADPGFADADRGQGRQERALCPDADAGVIGFVIPARDEVANPESILTERDYGFRVRSFGPSRNDETEQCSAARIRRLTPDEFPQLSCGASLQFASARSCWSARTAPARPI